MTDFEYREIANLSEQQAEELFELQKICFPELTSETVRKDYYHPVATHIFTMDGENIVAWAGIHIAETEFQGDAVKLGGFGLCTHPDWRKKGIAQRLYKLAMNHIEDAKCDVAFHSVDTDQASTIRFHEKKGFVIFRRPFAWTDAEGQRKEMEGSMIKPLNSRELFEKILTGKEALYVGEGYW